MLVNISSLVNIVATALGKKQRSPTANVSPLDVDLNIANPYEIDTSDAYGNQKIDAVQSMFVDNSQNPNSLTINLLQVGNSAIILPPNSQAYIPVICGDGAARLSFESLYTGVIPVVFLSIAMPAAIWFPEGASGGSDEVISGSTVTIPNGQALSTSIKRNALSLIGFQVPASTEGAQIEIKGSLTDGSFVSLINSAGQKAIYDISPGAGIYYVSGYEETQTANYFAFQTQDATGAAVNQSGACVITPIFAAV